MNDALTRKCLFFFIEQVIAADHEFSDEEVLDIRDFFRDLSDEFDIEERDG